ncbi:MAG: ATP-binding cassette domain-containing protein, partial [Planctomycetota bacterium]
MTEPTPRPAAQEPFEGACEALSALTRAAGSGPTFDPGTPLRTGEQGAVPLGALDWLVLAASDHSVPLEVIEAGAGEWPEWLRGDVPLLAALEPTEETPARWLLLERTDLVTARVRLFGTGEPEVSEVPLAELEAWVEHIGLEPGQRLRLAAVSSEPERSIAGGTSDGERLGPVRRLLMLIQPDRKDLLAVVLFAMVVGVLMLSTPIAVQSLVNTVALGANVPNLVLVVLLLGIGLAAAGVLRALQTWIVELLQRRLFVRVVADLAARLPRVALGEGSHRFGPELVNRYFDLMNIQKQGSFLLLEGLSLLLSVFVGLLVLAVYHPLLLAFDIVLIGVIALIALGPMRRGMQTAIKESSVKYEVAAWLEELARNPLLFKSSGAMKLVYEHTDSLAREWVERRSQHFGVVFFQGVSAIALQVGASVLLLGIGG